jgi:hypothetical protein
VAYNSGIGQIIFPFLAKSTSKNAKKKWGEREVGLFRCMKMITNSTQKVFRESHRSG